MATQAKLVYGSKLKRSIASVFTDVAEVLNWSGPSMEASDVIVTNLDSADGYEESIGGIKKGGEVSFSCNYTKTEYDRLLTVFHNQTVESWRWVLTDGSQVNLTGTLKGLNGPNGDGVETQLTADYTIKVTGKPTFTPA